MTRLKRAFDWLLSHSLLSPARGGIDFPIVRGCSERESRIGPGTAPPMTRATPSTKNSARADDAAGRSTQGGRVHGHHG